MKKNLIAFLLIFTLLLPAFSTNALAYDYTIIGDKVPTGISSLSIRSPLHGTYENTPVNATYNEPRDSRWHQGVDLKTNDGTSYKRDVFPVYSGVVHGQNNGSGNRYVIVKHTYNGVTFYSTYMHLDSVSVSNGDSVTTSTKIGISGTSGTTAPHLHWELNTTGDTYLNSTRDSIDPFPLLKNYYGDTKIDWLRDTTLVKDVELIGNDLYAYVWGISGGKDTAPSANPTIYWQYDNETTWRANTMSLVSGFKYKFTVPSNSQSSTIRYTIFVQGTWWNGTADHTYWHAKYKYPAPNPNNMTSQPLYETVSLAPPVTSLTTSSAQYINGDAVRVFKIVGSGQNSVIETHPYSSGSDTYIELYSDANLTNMITYNDDGGEGLYSKIEMYLNNGQEYYLKVRHYSSGSPVYTKVTLSNNITHPTLTSYDYVNGESFKVWRVTGSGSRTIETSAYSSGSDTYLELYSDPELTNRIAYDDDSGEGLYSKINYNMTVGVNYYVKVRNYSNGNPVYCRIDLY